MNNKILDNKTVEMISKANEAMHNAYAPYSNFTVGSCLRTEDNQLFVGCNVENVSFSLTQCAEASALGSLVSAGHRRIVEAVIVTKSEQICPPCGACRQRFAEFADPDTKIYLCFNHEVKQITTVADLLPLPFSFSKQV
jgi:cytidine deaminase